jgi:hypothetical protein
LPKLVLVLVLVLVLELWLTFSVNCPSQRAALGRLQAFVEGNNQTKKVSLSPKTKSEFSQPTHQ